MKVKLFLTFLLIASSAYCQTDWERWGAKEVSYELPEIEGKNYKFDRSSFTMSIVSGLKNAYYFLFSDLDGDNCPFHQSCSNFFVESVKETNIFQGSLMFADRFTRDLNLFKANKYPLHKSGKYYDPLHNYKLQSNDIVIFPSNEIVTE